MQADIGKPGCIQGTGENEINLWLVDPPVERQPQRTIGFMIAAAGQMECAAGAAIAPGRKLNRGGGEP